jgi:hypothetical protein
MRTNVVCNLSIISTALAEAEKKQQQQTACVKFFVRRVSQRRVKVFWNEVW